jgi:5-methyltetrahydropteroyltriglutamate--homocysteine methyltransferase
MQRTKPPFRADHVGSLLRPKYLLDAREQRQRGRLPAEELREMEDDAIRRVVRQQEDVGLQSVTDGEFRRDNWYLDFIFALVGIGRSADGFDIPFSGGLAYKAPRFNINGKVACPPGGVMRDHFEFLYGATREVAKISIPAPAMLLNLFADATLIDPAVYPDPEEFWIDLGRAYNGAMRELAGAGCRYLQLDDVNSCLLCSTEVREESRKAGREPEQLLTQFISLNNAAVAGRPADMAVTVHMCRGNYRSEWVTSGGYEAVAERYFNEMDVDGFFLEYDSERAGDFAPLRFLPKGKVAVLGLVTSKTPELEPADELKRRIEEAAKVVPLEQLCLSPQCGFASTQEGNRLTEDQQMQKLELIVQVAEDVWGRD